MIRSTNNELTEFNNSKKNLKRISECSGYIFISCPDFSHKDGRYTFRSIGQDIPLSVLLAQQTLCELSVSKKAWVYLSDHEATRLDVRCQLRTTEEYIRSCINASIEKIKPLFSETGLLSSLYSYDDVLETKETVPEDYHLQSALIQWSDGGGTLSELKNRYKEKYAQMYVFMEYCKNNNLCPIFLYSKFNLNLISNIRKIVTIPVLFLDSVDPH